MVFAFACAVAFQANAAPIAPAAITWIDGDTFEAGEVRYRIEGLDAPEMRGSCLAERRLAALALAHARSLTARARVAEIHPGALDRYGRTLAGLTLDGRDFTAAMIEAGYGQEWRRRRSWCG